MRATINNRRINRLKTRLQIKVQIKEILTRSKRTRSKRIVNLRFKSKLRDLRAGERIIRLRINKVSKSLSSSSSSKWCSKNNARCLRMLNRFKFMFMMFKRFNQLKELILK